MNTDETSVAAIIMLRRPRRSVATPRPTSSSPPITFAAPIA